MSTQASGGRTGPPDTEEIHAGEFLLIGVFILCLLVCLMVIRFGFNLFLDCCILDNSDQVWQSISKFWRTCCPWWHRRTQPATAASNEEQQQQQQQQQHDNNGNDRNEISSWNNDLELAGYRRTITDNKTISQATMQSRLLRILPSSILSSDDIRKWNEEQQHHKPVVVPRQSVDDGATPQNGIQGGDEPQGESDLMMCSICIQELQQGDVVFTTQQCDHVFHKACISEWMSSSSSHIWEINRKDCPNCRTRLFSRSTWSRMLKEHENDDECTDDV